MSAESLSALAEAFERAGRALREAVVSEVKGGMSVTEAAKIVGVTRQTIYRWQASEGAGSSGAVDLAETLNEALGLLSTLIGPTNAETVAKRITNSSISVKLLGIRIGMSSLTDPAHLTDEERSVLMAGTIAAERADHFHKIHSRYPRKVRLTRAAESISPEGDDLDDEDD